MSANSESQTIQWYSYLFNNSVPKDDNYWKVFFALPYHYVSLNSTFEHITARQVQDKSKVLHLLFEKFLEAPNEPNSLHIARIFIRNVCAKNYGDHKNDVMLKIFGNMSELDKNFVGMLKQLKANMALENEPLKFASFKLFSTCIRAFYNTLIFEIFYRVDLNDEIYDLFLIENLEYEIIGEIFITLSILNNNLLVSSNFYKLKIDQVFTKQQILSNLNFQLKQFMIMSTVFYYDLKPDLLVKAEHNSTFLNWITFNRYNDKVNNYKTFLLANMKEEDLKFYADIKMDRFKRRKEFVKELIPIYLYLFSLVMNNDEYGGLFTSKIEEEGDIEILEVFLSLSSFVLQHQHSYNSLISRLTLIIINKFVTSNWEHLSAYYINQYQVKLCYQRQPIINPVGELEYLAGVKAEEENVMVRNKNSFYYILDVIQCQLRYNLSKKLDLINYKVSNLIIFRVIDKLDYSQNYNWHDFFRTLFHVFSFLTKNFSNDEKIAALVEEILIIVEIMLVNFSETEKKNDMVELIYKILEHNGALLVVKNYSNGNLPNLTILLEQVISKFSSKTDANYNEIYSSLADFIKSDEEFSISSNGLYDKIMKLDVEFEQPETFKYLKMSNIFNNNKITLVNKSIEEIVNDTRLFY